MTVMIPHKIKPKETMIIMGNKIYLSPSNQDGNLYAYGNTNECEVCNRIADAAKDALERCGFTVKKAPKGQNMNISIAESNSWGADLHIPIHTNAGGGSGTMCMVKNADIVDYKWATGFESLIGYLYLTNQKERLKIILEKCMDM